MASKEVSDAVREKRRAYYQKHKQRHIETARRRLAAHPEYWRSPERRAIKRRYWANHPDQHERRRLRVRLVKAAKRRWLDDYKRGKPCTDCGTEYPPPVMEFDHPNDDKECNVSTMVARNYSRRRIEVEIAKCELVCANCHRIRTFTRRK
jgi:hypothetical protein